MVCVTQDSSAFAERLPVFATPEYLSARSGEFGWHVGNGFVLPFYVDKRFVFRRLVFTNETVILPGADPANEPAFLNAVIERVRAEGRVDFIAKPQANAVFHAAPDGCETVEWGSYVAALNGDDGTLLGRVQARTRSAIRKAIREGITTEPTEDLSVVHWLLRGTMNRQGLPFYPSRGFLQSCVARRPAIVRFYVARRKSVPQGCAVVFLNALGAYYYYGGSIPNPYPGSIPLLHYRIMLDLRDQGIPRYDFMGARTRVEKGSRMEGIQRFKSHMGTQFVRGCSFRLILRPFRHRLFNATARLYLLTRGQSYHGDAIDDERRMKNPVYAPGTQSTEDAGDADA